METNTKCYIPDSSRAESWLTDEVFTWRGKKFKVLPNFKVVRIPKNSDGKRPQPGGQHE